MTELNQRIDAALAENITPDALMQLIADTEEALSEATTAAAETTRISLDPIASPDIRRAQASVEIADYKVNALKSALRKLTRKYYELQIRVS